MAADQATVHRVRDLLAGRTDVRERRMFGGVAFMVAGHMLGGVHKDHLMLRVGPEQHAEALRQPHAGPMDFTGRPMRGYVTVRPEGYDADLEHWVETALRFVTTLPPK